MLLEKKSAVKRMYGNTHTRRMPAELCQILFFVIRKWKYNKRVRICQICRGRLRLNCARTLLTSLNSMTDLLLMIIIYNQKNTWTKVNDNENKDPNSIFEIILMKCLVLQIKHEAILKIIWIYFKILSESMFWRDWR